MIFKGRGCFKFPEAVVTSTAKEKSYAVPNAVHISYRCFIGVVTAVNNCNKLR